MLRSQHTRAVMVAISIPMQAEIDMSGPARHYREHMRESDDHVVEWAPQRTRAGGLDLRCAICKGTRLSLSRPRIGLCLCACD